MRRLPDWYYWPVVEEGIRLKKKRNGREDKEAARPIRREFAHDRSCLPIRIYTTYPLLYIPTSIATPNCKIERKKHSVFWCGFWVRGKVRAVEKRIEGINCCNILSLGVNCGHKEHTNLCRMRSESTSGSGSSLARDMKIASSLSGLLAAPLSTSPFNSSYSSRAWNSLTSRLFSWEMCEYSYFCIFE